MRRVEALDILAEASGLLASSFELEATLPQVAELCIRELADYCSIVTSGPGGTPAIAEAARDAKWRSRSGTAASPEALKKRGLRTVIAVPLGGRDAVHGTFVLAAQEGGAFNAETEKLATVLAVLVVNALEQAALFARTYRVADRLQRALLPESFPRVEGATLYGAYRPASDESEVGGDWYDAFTLPDGRVALSLGDVAGHGLEAATIMGEIRQAMRSVAVGDFTPAGVLEHINGVTNLRASIGMVTAIFGYYDPATRGLTYAAAGHPSPIVTVADGVSAFLPGGGVPLGVEPSIDATDWRVTLPPGSQVIFYTDGLTEYDRDVVLGEALLLKAAARHDVRSAANPAEGLQNAIFSKTTNRDDAAALTLHCAEGTVHELLSFSAIPLVAPLVRSAMNQIADSCNLNEERRFALLLGTGEAIANAVEHAYRGNPRGEITVRTQITPTTVTVEIEDQGRWRPFVQREERGRGISLMHKLMDGVRITSTQTSTVVTLTLARHAVSA
ncbi:MAG TPA: SpoIIE family protein phosphatase [Candidatus Baltobacteraceae bacterium]|jgi:anti-sigma regulatory factor (Ser/Thr protein kinase)